MSFEEDDDEIAVWVVPKLDEDAAEETEHKLRDRLSHATDGIKDGLQDLSEHFSGVGDKLKDTFKDSLGGLFGGDHKDLLDGLIGHASGLEDLWDNLGQRAGSALGAGIGNAVHDVLGGNFGDAFGHGLDPIIGEFQHVGDTIDKALGTLGTKLDGLKGIGEHAGNIVTGNSDSPLDDITGVIDGAKGLGLHIPGPIGLVEDAKKTLDWLHEHPETVDKVNNWFADHVPGMETIYDTVYKGPEEAGTWLHNLVTGPPKAAEPHDAASDKWLGSVANEVKIDSTSAMIEAGSVSLGGNISLPGLSAATASGSGAGHSTSSGISASAGTSAGSESLYAGDTGGMTLGHYDHGGVIPGDSPGHDNLIGMLPGGSVVGLEGGEGVIRPGAMQTPGVADIVASLNKHYSGGTPPGETVSGAPVPTTAQQPKPNAGNEVIGGDHGPESGVHTDASGHENAQENPQLPGTPARPGQEKPGQVIDPHGTGQGFGIQGGLIGMAEGAAAMGADAFAPGSGMAVSAAEQEVNNAIGYAGKVAGILGIEMPLDTFGLSDSRYSNVAQSWVGKIGLSLVGGHNDTPDVAGKTQAPLTGPNEHGSPLGGKQGGGDVSINIGTQNNHSQMDHDANWRSISNQYNAYSSGTR